MVQLRADDYGNGVVGAYNRKGMLKVKAKTGQDLIAAGANTDGDGLLRVNSKTGQPLIFAAVGGYD